MQDKELRIKVILLEVDARSYLEKGIEEELKKYGSFQIELDYMTIPYSETEKQVRALRSCIGEKVQGVILSPINSPEIVKEIDACTLAGIPVVTVNTDIKGSQRLCFIGQDGFKAVGDVLEEYEREDIKQRMKGRQRQAKSGSRRQKFPYDKYVPPRESIRRFCVGFHRLKNSFSSVRMNVSLRQGSCGSHGRARMVCSDA